MAGVFFYWKCCSKLLLKFYSIGYAKIENSKGFKLLEMLKYGTTRVLYCSKIKNKVWAGFFS